MKIKEKGVEREDGKNLWSTARLVILATAL
jgi:hypothetical protein